MNAADRQLIADATAFALEAHRGQRRKGTKIPYVSHVIRVCGLVLEHGGDARQAAAGLLHDTIEDCGVSEAELRGRFGADVAKMVRALSDVLEGDTARNKSDWLKRKRRYVAHLARVKKRVRLVSACDKLDNLRALVDDVATHGVRTLRRFSGSPSQIRWYYEAVIEALGTGIPPRLRAELRHLAAELARFVPEASEKP
ncbi:MAG: bifunctional (p)ppGpp synthetase/guanosine-3',5'-bis(diphosphate) 3'-pyrophosphohydrolase [Deltaproteobacteria bacterium]|nr:bifunctional (p)ppGpp synthetase/guanosine-3',5'-bis(diphosphate) 3'-pyrophosphohydrolase [Deltaproteobacteria bacterium]